MLSTNGFFSWHVKTRIGESLFFQTLALVLVRNRFRSYLILSPVDTRKSNFFTLNNMNKSFGPFSQAYNIVTY